SSVAGDYSAPTTGTLTITPEPIVVTGTKVYNGTTSFTVGQLSVASGAVGTDSVTLSAGTGASSSAHVAGSPYTGSTLTGLTLNVTGGTFSSVAGDYLAPTTGTLTITPEPIV